jgi:hypothetical protein
LADPAAVLGSVTEHFPPRCRFGTIRADILADMDFAPVKWAIPRLVPEGLAILAGKPKLGKSFLSLQMCEAVGSGDGKVFGVDDVEPGDVLYCALEDSQRRLHSRLHKMHPWGGAISDRIHFATEWPRIGEGCIEGLEGWLKDHPKAKLIILDTWRAIKPMASGRGGSAYDEDAIGAAPLLEFTKAHPGLAVIVVHHVRKMESDDIFDTISGTHGLTGIFDTLMVLARHGEGVKLAAQGRDLEGYEKALDRDKLTGGWNIKGDAVEIAKTAERHEMLEALADANGEPLALGTIASAVGKKKDTTRRLLAKLVKDGRVTQPSYGKYALSTHSNYSKRSNSQGRHDDD